MSILNDAMRQHIKDLPLPNTESGPSIERILSLCDESDREMYTRNFGQLALSKLPKDFSPKVIIIDSIAML